MSEDDGVDRGVDWGCACDEKLERFIFLLLHRFLLIDELTSSYRTTNYLPLLLDYYILQQMSTRKSSHWQPTTGVLLACPSPSPRAIVSLLIFRKGHRDSSAVAPNRNANQIVGSLQKCQNEKGDSILPHKDSWETCAVSTSKRKRKCEFL